MCVLAQIKDPKLLPYGAWQTPDSFVIHDRKYRPIIRLAAHEDQDEPCEEWGNANLPGAMDLDCHAKGGAPCFIRVRPETARAVDPSERIEHEEGLAYWFYKGQPDRDHLQNLVDSIPGLGAEIKRRDVATAAAKKAEREAFEWQAEAGARYDDWLEALLAKPPLEVTDADLRQLPIQDRLQLETKIMMARHEAAQLEMAQFARDIKTGKIPMPSNVVPFSKSADSDVALTNQPAQDAAVKHEDFWAYSPAHSYIFTPTGEHWPASTVNARLAPVVVPMREKPMAAATYLDQNRSVEQATWAPGQPQIIENRLIADGGWIDRVGCKTFNLYRPPTIKPKAGDAAPWVEHVRWVYPDEADHIIKWLAQRVQRPEQKINHALVLGGNQGIGKDTLLEPVKAAVGPWNCSEVSPQQVLGRFNGFVKSVILRISEARDLGETDRFAYYEHLKTLTAAPPDVLRVDEKHLREHAVLNCCGVIQTTNNKDALHLPIDDRRHFVAWSPRSKDDFQAGYWSALYNWFAGGGSEVVAHYLGTLDLSGFDAKAPPPKTRAFWEIVDASRAPEDAEMADAIDALGKPDAVTVQMVLSKASMGFGEWLRDRRNRRRISHRFEGCGYVPVRNPDDVRDGQWKIAGRRQTVYSKREMSTRDQIAAAQRLT